MDWPSTTSNHTIGIGFGTAGLGTAGLAAVTEMLCSMCRGIFEGAKEHGFNLRQLASCFNMNHRLKWGQFVLDEEAGYTVQLATMTQVDRWKEIHKSDIGAICAPADRCVNVCGGSDWMNKEQYMKSERFEEEKAEYDRCCAEPFDISKWMQLFDVDLTTLPLFPSHLKDVWTHPGFFFTGSFHDILHEGKQLSGCAT